MKSIITIFLGALVVFAWGPWVDKGFIREKLSLDSQKEVLASKTQNVCVFKEVLTTSRTAFGYTVSTSYLCNGTDQMKRNMFVSSFGKVFVLSKLKDINAEPLY